ncbi:hypothetical protein H9P43_005644 [Blastocladiella emersonii ATCC 22665]|nr:hypothetical protein H9P43_005644 [Blastocladiella emersonii ATCC 22665]
MMRLRSNHHHHHRAASPAAGGMVSGDAPLLLPPRNVIASVTSTEIEDAKRAYKDVIKVVGDMTSAMRTLANRARDVAATLANFADSAPSLSDAPANAIRQFATLQSILAAGLDTSAVQLESDLIDPLRQNYAAHKANIKATADRFRQARDHNTKQVKAIERHGVAKVSSTLVNDPRARGDPRTANAHITEYQGALRDLARLANELEGIKNAQFDAIMGEEHRNVAFLADRCHAQLVHQSNALYGKAYAHCCNVQQWSNHSVAAAQAAAASLVVHRPASPVRRNASPERRALSPPRALSPTWPPSPSRHAVSPTMHPHAHFAPQPAASHYHHHAQPDDQVFHDARAVHDHGAEPMFHSAVDAPSAAHPASAPVRRRSSRHHRAAPPAPTLDSAPAVPVHHPAPRHRSASRARPAGITSYEDVAHLMGPSSASPPPPMPPPPPKLVSRQIAPMLVHSPGATSGFDVHPSPPPSSTAAAFPQSPDRASATGYGGGKGGGWSPRATSAREAGYHGSRV